VNHKALWERREKLLGAGAPLFYEKPIHIVRGEGVWLFDADGRKYLDMYNNVPCVGHSHPHVVAALSGQASILNVHSRYLHEGILNYAERLMNLHADPLTSVVFTCSGTEASEVAIRIARSVTGGRGIIGTNAGYHGNSTEVRKVTGRDCGSEFRTISFPQTFRPLNENVGGSDLTELYLNQVESAIRGLQQQGISLAGMFVCSILANEGLPDIPIDFMPRAAELVSDAGGLFIADEVQAGFCRTGHWWGYEATGFRPDIVTMGKPMGNGLPLAATAARVEHITKFRKETDYFNTFASTPLQAAVGMAVLDVIEQEGLQDNVVDVGSYLVTELRNLQHMWECMGDVRGHGLFIGIDWIQNHGTKLPDELGAVAAVNNLKNKGFLISNSGVHKNVLKIRPPLVFLREHADLFLSAFEETLRELHAN
jgi:4-aminobutyrate aminotransferase-like enzyme